MCDFWLKFHLFPYLNHWPPQGLELGLEAGPGAAFESYLRVRSQRRSYDLLAKEIPDQL